ncbi:hypothetical protein AVEN_224944-1 [Araneus ventricosus]|uniref:Uncharacterized protein n=1 Tax=Araneus ventricosus TaxID=182803 RepID=A0A4Y2Q666_ARAVE|nr:hypothetical protein AVEN_224944-1 [Araneus ventricosus]
MEFSEFLSPKQLTTLDNKILREKAATLANMYRDDLDKDELSVEIESFKYSVIDRCMQDLHRKVVNNDPEFQTQDVEQSISE